MNNAVVVEVRYGGEGGSDKVGSIRLVVTAFAAYAVEEFAAEGEVGNEIDLGDVCST